MAVCMSVFVCLSVTLQNFATSERLSWRRLPSSDLSLHCVVFPKIRKYFCPKFWTSENFTRESRSCCGKKAHQQSRLLRHVLDGRCHAHRAHIVYYMLVDRNCFVMDLLHNLFLQLFSSWHDFDWQRVARSVCNSRSSFLIGLLVSLDVNLFCNLRSANKPTH